MTRSFTKDEKMLLIAVVKYILSTDGVMTDREVEDINAIAGRKGFEDFSELFNEVDRNVRSMDDLKKLVKKVTNETIRKEIVRYAIEISEADAIPNPHEIEILKYMCAEWGLRLDSFLK
jgi:acetate kinase